MAILFLIAAPRCPPVTGHSSNEPEKFVQRTQSVPAHLIKCNMLWVDLSCDDIPDLPAEYFWSVFSMRGCFEMRRKTIAVGEDLRNFEDDMVSTSVGCEVDS